MAIKYDEWWCIIMMMNDDKSWWRMMNPWQIYVGFMMNDDDRSYDESMLSPWWIHNESWMTMKDTIQDEPRGNHCLLKVGAIGSHDGLQSKVQCKFREHQFVKMLTAAANILSTAADTIAVNQKQPLFIWATNYHWRHPFPPVVEVYFNNKRPVFVGHSIIIHDQWWLLMINVDE